MSVWESVITAVAQAAANDVELQGIYGERIRMAGSHERYIPGLEYHLIANSDDPEIWEVVIIQWDQWCKSLAQLSTSEVALKRLFDEPLFPVELIPGVVVWMWFTDGADLVAPSRTNLFGRAMRFRAKALTERYITT